VPDTDDDAPRATETAAPTTRSSGAPPAPAGVAPPPLRLAFPPPTTSSTFGAGAVPIAFPAPSQPPPRDDEPAPGLAQIGPVHERRARDWALVLQSMGLWHVRRHAGFGWVLWVNEGDRARAERAIQRYEQENRDWPPREARERPRFGASPVAPLLFLALIAFATITGPASGGSAWFARGASIADVVLRAEPWRAVTALTLHADSAHVLGNAISGSIFGSAVNRRLGAGGGTLAVVASGVLGNVANAVFHGAVGQGSHGSIGASTAVFGAIGVLATTQLLLDRSQPRPRSGWLQMATPITGGLALLGSLGASPTSDLGAHLFGFLAGMALGLAAAWPFRLGASLGAPEARPPIATRLWAQALMGAAAAALVLGSWHVALTR
jgi:membrane associated rhomboid family serine protease